jgi:hypothetical protein
VITLLWLDVYRASRAYRPMLASARFAWRYVAASVRAGVAL